MKKLSLLVLFFTVTVLLVPLCTFWIVNYVNDGERASGLNDDTENRIISVYFPDRDTIEKIEIEEYLCGVVAAEMPASFEKEALKAQSVAARSYALYREKKPTLEHPDAAVCTDFTHCKAYKNKEEAFAEWGKNAQSYYKKIQNAVFSTKGEVITYNGEVALAVFHSQSGGGRTENSADVWGGEIPYLVSVESHGEETAPNFYSSAVFSFEEFKDRVLAKYPNNSISSVKDIGEIEKSEGGSVKSIKIGGEKISGKDIRTIFNLRSSCFTINVSDTTVTFEVTGYGHGVGMSQYGANTMAKEGYNYKQILTHYYSGTQVEGV